MSLSVEPSGESVIIAALRNGDLRRAVELLHEAYQDEVLSYCGRLLGAAGAVEAYQRVLSSAIQDLSSRVSEASIKGWLFAIARNVVIHQHQLRRAEFPGALSRDYVPVGDASEQLGVAPRDRPLQSSLQQLEPIEQEVLQLALWHDLKLAEIAEVIGRSPREVRRLAARGLMRISHLLPPGEGDPS